MARDSGQASNGASRAHTGFSVTMRREADAAIIEISGELALESADAVRHALRDAEESDIGRITIDLSRVTFIDSTGLSVLLKARKRDRELSDRLRFVHSEHDQVTRLLSLTGTGEFLDLADSGTSAV